MKFLISVHRYLLIAFLLLFCPVMVFGGQAYYIYDDLGRVSKVVNDAGNYLLYQYDSVGNLLQISNGTITANPPTISSISPNVAFIGSTTYALITGTNLFATTSVKADNPNIQVKIVSVQSTQVAIRITVPSSVLPGNTNLTVTTIYGSATVQSTLVASTLTFIPYQLSLAPGSNGWFTAIIHPPLSNAVTIALQSSNPAVVSAPQTVTIPSSGSANFNIGAVNQGYSFLSSGSTVSTIYVTPPFAPAPGDQITEATGPVSVSIGAPSSSSTISEAAPVSVSVNALSTYNTISEASPVSVSVNALSSFNTISEATPVSVSVNALSSFNTMSDAAPVSVSVGTPASSTNTISEAGPVSVSINALSSYNTISEANPVSVSVNALSSYNTISEANPVSVSINAPASAFTTTVSPVVSVRSLLLEIIASAGPNGSVSPAGITMVGYGGSQTYTITPSPGVNISDVLVDGVSVGAVSSYTFSNVSSNHTISATFGRYTITASSGPNGSVTPIGLTTVGYGGSQTYAITPSAGCSISSVLVDGTSVGAVSSYTFSNVTANHTISATFVINSFAVTPSAGSNGSISPSTPQTVNYGVTTSFTVTPNTGYYITSVTGCEGTLIGNTYTTGPITGACTVAATFANTYAVYPWALANGNISPSLPQTLNYGATTSFTVTPNTGYHASVTGCGGSLSGNTYTTGPITANCTVMATFVINTFTVTPSAGTGGSMSPPTSQTVNYNATASFTVTPYTGYHISSVTGCGGTLAGNTYTTGPITANCTVAATFAINTYTVTPVAGANGTISPSTPQTVNYGATTSFTVTANKGHKILSVTGCGGTLNRSTYTTGPITSSCTVTATFQ